MRKGDQPKRSDSYDARALFVTVQNGLVVQVVSSATENELPLISAMAKRAWPVNWVHMAS